MLNKNSLGLLKMVWPCKQSRIKNIIWPLIKWLVRKRTGISLQPSGSVRPKIDIKLWPSALVRTGTDVAANWTGKIIQGLILEQICLLKLSFGHFLYGLLKVKSSQMTIKSSQMTILKDWYVYLL